MALFSSFSLLAGMNMSPVSRLKKTWSKVKTAKFFILEVKNPNQTCWYTAWIVFWTSSFVNCHIVIPVWDVCRYIPGQKARLRLEFPRHSEEGVKLLISRGESEHSNRRETKTKTQDCMQAIVLPLMPVLFGHGHNAECKAPQLYLGCWMNKAQGFLCIEDLAYIKWAVLILHIKA